LVNVLPPSSPGSCLAKDTDIVDEAIYYFKANVFFKNYEIKVKYRACNPSLSFLVEILSTLQSGLL
jgi:hypothetical protein